MLGHIRPMGTTTITRTITITHSVTAMAMVTGIPWTSTRLRNGGKAGLGRRCFIARGAVCGLRGVRVRVRAALAWTMSTSLWCLRLRRMVRVLQMRFEVTPYVLMSGSILALRHRRLVHTRRNPGSILSHPTLLYTLTPTPRLRQPAHGHTHTTTRSWISHLPHLASSNRLLHAHSQFP